MTTKKIDKFTISFIGMVVTWLIVVGGLASMFLEWVPWEYFMVPLIAFVLFGHFSVTAWTEIHDEDLDPTP